MNWLFKLIILKGLFKSLTAMCNNAAHYGTISENIRETRNVLLMLTNTKISDINKYSEELKQEEKLKERLAKLNDDIENSEIDLDINKKAKFAAINRKHELQMEIDQLELKYNDFKSQLDEIQEKIESHKIVISEETLLVNDTILPVDETE